MFGSLSGMFGIGATGGQQAYNEAIQAENAQRKRAIGFIEVPPSITWTQITNRTWHVAINRGGTRLLYGQQLGIPSPPLPWDISNRREN